LGTKPQNDSWRAYIARISSVISLSGMVSMKAMNDSLRQIA
jgi:hypothetical protein